MGALVLFGAVLGAGVTSFGEGRTAWNDLPPASAPGLTVVALPRSQDQHFLAVVDPHAQSVAVYQVASNGWLSLKSVRNIHWDLQLDAFNSEDPLPSEVRSQIEAR